MVSLDALRAADGARVSAAQIGESAVRLGVEAEALKAIVQVESAGQGFADGRPLIMFDAAAFKNLAGAEITGGGGAGQADRWSKLAAAYAINADAALQATNFGLFQTPGLHFAAAGYGSVSALAADLARSEASQLAVFEQAVSGLDLLDELRNRDWAAFSRTYHPTTDSSKYASAVQRAYESAKAASAPPVSDGFLGTLVAKSTAKLNNDDIAASAARMQCEPACVRAVLKVESGGSGFGADGRPIILYEPHIFSRLTNHQFDQSHPTISYLSWKTRPYPKTQAERYQQVAEAFVLDPEAAVAAASWGLFQILGSNYKACGFPSATAFVSDIAQSEVQMLKAFESFVASNKLLEPLRKKDWAAFARVYNGPGQVETYSTLLKKAYDSAVATA